ncbi:MAG: hypothetical protein ACRESO_04600, partial [Gammaproteobacteria bacterium]
SCFVGAAMTATDGGNAAMQEQKPALGAITATEAGFCSCKTCISTIHGGRRRPTIKIYAFVGAVVPTAISLPPPSV